MAHKGKIWRLWFRRDAAWSENNYTLAFPEAFYCSFQSGIFSRRYAVSLFPTVNAINLHKDYVRTWESERVGGIFDNVFWRFEIPVAPNAVIDRVRFSIWHGALISTPLYDATYRILGALGEYGNFQMISVETLHFLSVDVTVDPYPLRLNIQAAQYDRYNP